MTLPHLNFTNFPWGGKFFNPLGSFTLERETDVSGFFYGHFQGSPMRLTPQADPPSIAFNLSGRLQRGLKEFEAVTVGPSHDSRSRSKGGRTRRGVSLTSQGTANAFRGEPRESSQIRRLTVTEANIPSLSILA